MKTKILLSIICTIFTISNIDAQTSLNTTKTVYEDGYTYQCDKQPWDIIYLYNKNNQYTYTECTYKDGSKLSFDLSRGNISTLEDDNWTKPKACAIVDSAFSKDEAEKVKGYKLGIDMIISPETGKVIEVYFYFYYTEPFANIPVSVYRKIELALKEQVWFTPTTAGKQLNILGISWDQKIDYIPRKELTFSPSSITFGAVDTSTKEVSISGGLGVTTVSGVPSWLTVTRSSLLFTKWKIKASLGSIQNARSATLVFKSANGAEGTLTVQQSRLDVY